MGRMTVKQERIPLFISTEIERYRDFHRLCGFIIVDMLFRLSCVACLGGRQSQLMKDVRKSRVVTQLISNIWKMVVTFLMMFATVGINIEFIGGKDPWMAFLEVDR